MQVLTTRGLVDLSRLTVKDVVEVGDNHRKTATEWYLGEELVRRDVHINMLRPVLAAASEGDFNGR